MFQKRHSQITRITFLSQERQIVSGDHYKITLQTFYNYILGSLLSSPYQDLTFNNNDGCKCVQLNCIKGHILFVFIIIIP